MNDLTVGASLPIAVTENLAVKPAISYVYLPDSDIRAGAEALYLDKDALVGSVTLSCAF